jgi:excinuclease ABC subunit B
VIMYADTMTDSMKAAIGETSRRRALQAAYNTEHGITPTSVVKSIDDVLTSIYERDYIGVPEPVEKGRLVFRSQAELDAHLAGLEKEMKAAAANLDFEKAAGLRDQIRAIKTRDLGLGAPTYS